jgi:hypothetical protein
MRFTGEILDITGLTGLQNSAQPAIQFPDEGIDQGRCEFQAGILDQLLEDSLVKNLNAVAVAVAVAPAAALTTSAVNMPITRLH